VGSRTCRATPQTAPPAWFCGAALWMAGTRPPPLDTQNGGTTVEFQQSESNELHNPKTRTSRRHDASTHNHPPDPRHLRAVAVDKQTETRGE
jgi:hypothetical protein